MIARLRLSRLLSLTLVATLNLTPSIRAQVAPATLLDSATLAQLRFRYIGPVGNRVSSVAGVPGDANVYYAGAASGGIWKTTDAGIHWTPIFDDKDVSSIGALAVAPSNPSIVWAGTGEPFIRSHISIGNGVYKSTDAGRTWTRMGLEESGRIGRFAIDPKNPDIVFVAAQGHSYGPQQERGIYRTTDGGRTWTRVLFVDPNTGGIDVVMHPTNPQTLFAAMWQLEMHTWTRESGGPGSGIFVSRDGGTTWTRLKGNGLPTRTIGKIGLAIAPSKPERVYALIETGDGVPIHGQPTDNGELWRSDDGGNTWRVVSYDRNLACRQPYYTRMVVSTDNPDETYFLCAAFSRSLDGGVTDSAASPGGAGGGVIAAAAAAAAARVPADSAALRTPALSTPGGDNHDMWIDPTNANRMAVANDAGISISTTRGRTWLRVQLPIAQIYHVTVDNRIPYYVYGNKQDGPSYRGPSNSRTGNTIARSEWHGVDGGESGWATPDPVDPNIVWSTASGSGSRGGIVVRFDLRTRQSQNVEVWPLSTGGHPAADLRYRFIWDAPFTISPHDHNRVYIGSQFVHVTADGGRSWQVISPDLTRNDKSKQQISGGLTPDNIGVEYGSVIYAIAESRAQAGVMWTGSNDGLVHVSRDAGKTWTNVTRNIPGIPAWGSVRHIEPSRYDVGSAYLIVDGHQENNRDPWAYRTKDFGKTWKLIVSGIPKSPLSYAHIIREDPVRRGLLYLGTENALYVSFDDGDHWQPLKMNLPHAPVYGLVIQEHFNDLVIGTYGRGFWILDDLSPLQNLTSAVTASAAQLLKPRPSYRFVDIGGNYATTDDPTAGTNPPYGAAINYWLRAAHPDTGTNAPSLAILDGTGKTIRTLRGTGKSGINRVYWNLRNDSSKIARLRTRPSYNAEFRMDRDSTRSAPGVGRMSVLMPPGSYTVKLTVDGQSYTQPLEVRKDPNDDATEQDIAASTATLLALQNDLSTVVDILGSVESLRLQLQRLSATGDVRSRADALEQKLIAVEQNILDLRMTGRGQDEVRYPVKLGGQLNYLAGGVAASDLMPTRQQQEVQQLLANQVRETRSAFDRLMQTDLPAFNEVLRGRGMKLIDVPAQEAAPMQKLGTVHFATSCSAAAQPVFNRAVALLHSFEFRQAIEGFNTTLKVDPTCGIAYWGLALSAWGNPFAIGIKPAKQIEGGLDAVQHGRTTGSGTQREKDYLAAASLLYENVQTIDQGTRLTAYRDAMSALAARYPDDTEASIFYALALAVSADPADKTYANQLEAGAILENLVRKYPHHPGLAHYIIHSYDFPPLAARALHAAHSYSMIAPSAPHALHMPSHTFTRVGDWQESIDTNIASTVTARREQAGAEELHASDYMMYAYLQTGQDRAAHALLESIPQIVTRFDPTKQASAAPPSAGYFAMAAMPARYALERHAWRDAAQLAVRTSPFPYADAITHFARALGAARSGDTATAKSAIAALQRIRDELIRLNEKYWTEQAEIQIRGASAWQAFAEGRKDEALATMREAAEREDATEKSAITPGPIVPARELLGEMLLELNQPAEALKHFERTLTIEPRRFRTVADAAQAATAVGDRATAEMYYAQLIKICARGDKPGRAELIAARRMARRS